jgi:hypothetical protein
MAGKVDVCHVPPGNPANAHTISVSSNAVAAHLAHGDSSGACECGVNGDCTNDSLCDEDTCVRGKCQHKQVECELRPCVASASCVPATGQCVEVPLDCGDGVCDPSTGECGPCEDFLLSIVVGNPSTECPNSSGCVECCNERAATIFPEFLTCSLVDPRIDNFPTVCGCQGCGCLNGP